MNTKPVFNATNIDSVLSGPELYPWDMGPDVAELQKLLNAHGFSLRIDGDFGGMTEKAVRTYQLQHNLRCDGFVGPKTWASLKGTLQPGYRILDTEMSGMDVYELQGLLQVCGYGIHRTGMYDDETKQAVLSFQRRQKLKADGKVDSITWTMLRGGRALPPPPRPRRWDPSVRRWW